MKTLPNCITLSRIILVIPVLLLLFFESYKSATVLFLLASLTDGLDGILARYLQATSRLGSILDPIADKCLILASMVMLLSLQLFPLWLFVAIIIRDVVLLAGAVVYQMTLHRFEYQPTMISKANTFLQFVLILGILFHQGWGGLDYSRIEIIQFLVFVTSITSFMQYVGTWSRYALSERSQR